MAEKTAYTFYDNMVPGKSRIACMQRCGMVLVSTVEIYEHLMKNTN